MLDALIQHRELLYMLTWRDLRIRYKQSAMGFLWAILMPMMIVASGLLVRVGLSVWTGQPVDRLDVASITVRSIPWAFFIGSIRFAATSLTGNQNLVTKIYFPREVLPLSAVLVNLCDCAVAAAPAIIALVALRVGISIHLLWLPFLVGLLILLTAAIAIFLSCANLFFRDVKYIVEILLNFGIFFTPVFYEARHLGKWGSVLLLNPVGSLLEAITDVIVWQRSPDPVWLCYAAAWALLGFWSAHKIFDKAAPLFAEHI